MERARGRMAGAVILAAGVAASCATAGERAVKSLEGVAPGTRVRVEGTISLRGSTPFTILVVEMEGGEVAAIESRSAGIQSELRSLASLRAAVEGTVLPRLDGGMPRLDADRYELLRLPGGERPVVGLLEVEGEACVLTTREGKRYWVLGELAAALREYAGARVWIVGLKSDAPDAPRPKKSTPFTPTGYGVIDEAPAR
jgi:hypothetical protein